MLSLLLTALAVHAAPIHELNIAIVPCAAAFTSAEPSKLCTDVKPTAVIRFAHFNDATNEYVIRTSEGEDVRLVVRHENGIRARKDIEAMNTGRIERVMIDPSVPQKSVMRGYLSMSENGLMLIEKK